MDTSQDPCDDFYKFTCGNFIDQAYENNSPSQYYTQMLNIANKLNAIIAEPITGEEESVYLQLKRFYQSCMDVKAMDEEGSEPFKKLLEELGGWPVVEGQQWREEDFDLNELIIKCMDLGFPFQWFFEVTFSNDWFAVSKTFFLYFFYCFGQEICFSNKNDTNLLMGNIKCIIFSDSSSKNDKTV